jgi:hypothetical protein
MIKLPLSPEMAEQFLTILEQRRRFKVLARQLAADRAEEQRAATSTKGVTDDEDPPSQ